MNKPHKHAEVIKAWADGAEIEFRIPSTEGGWWFTSNPTEGEWWFTSNPTWVEAFEYRVKPQPKKYKVDVWLGFNPDGDFAPVVYATHPPEFTQSHFHVIHHTLEGELPNV